MKSTIGKILLPIILVVVAILAASTMIKMKPKAARQAPPTPRPVVTVHTIASDGYEVRVKGFGSVKAKRSVNVVPQVSGEVLEKSPAFEPGGYCTKGQVLLRLDDTDYVLAAARSQADVAQMELNLARAEEEAEVASQEWATMRRSGEAPEPSSLVLHEPQLKLARANLDAAKAALHQAEVNLGRCTITAPFDGRVLSTDVDAGQYLRAGNPVGTLYATDVAEVTVSVPDEDLAWIPIEGTGSGSAPETVVDIFADFAGSRHHWEGRAVRLGGAVDNRSRLVPVVVEITDPYKMVGQRPPLVEGMFVEVVFRGKPAEESVVIPRSALRPNNEVWVITQDRQVSVRNVTVARAGLDEAVIASGLTPGEMVCTSNLQYVTEGLPVRIEGETSPETSKDGE
jgi:membrane fusion protein, multidrug efflux system